MPATSPISSISHSETIIFAHRGASGYCHGNTFEAFDKAIELGAEGLEFDCWILKDHEVIIFHDRFILDPDSQTRHKFIIPQLTLKEIKALTLPNGEKIPTLSEFFDKYANTLLPHPINGFSKLLFSIDLQDNSVGLYIIPILKKYGVINRTFLCSSTLWKFHSLKAEYDSLAPRFIASNLEYNVKSEHLTADGKISKLNIEGFNIQAARFKDEDAKLIQDANKKLFVWDLHSKTLLWKFLRLHPS
ncbi:MAG: glycerophosphodiester phosphodiesterase, partial [Promethearchaeota archaeon]